MAKEVVWSQLATQRYQKIIVYLLKDWSHKEAENFIKIVDRKLLLLSDFPHIGIRSNKNPVIRQLLLAKHNRINYILEKDVIKILDIIDTRQQIR
jgi:plasmid stabilization system protein ParE